MFVVAGYTLRFWNWIWDFYMHLLLQPKYYSDIKWSCTKATNQTHRYPYSLHQRACSWWDHCSALLCITRESCRHLYQGIFWEDFQKYQITIGDIWSCGEDSLKTIFHSIFFMSMFKEGFSPLWFCLFLCFVWTSGM